MHSQYTMVNILMGYYLYIFGILYLIDKFMKIKTYDDVDYRELYKKKGIKKKIKGIMNEKNS